MKYLFIIKKLTHMIMEADKSQDLQLANRRPRSWWYSFPLNTGRLKTQKELMFQFSSKGRRRQISQLKAVRQEEFLLLAEGQSFFFSSLQLIEWGLLTLGRAICFTQFTDSNINLIQKHPHRPTQNKNWPNIWVPCDLLYWHIILPFTFCLTYFSVFFPLKLYFHS